MTALPVIPKRSVKDLFHFYLYLKNKHNHAVKAHPNRDHPTVIVIGAGLSGLCATKELTSVGFDVILIEARDRIGGRIHSIDIGDDRFIELGAQFVHGIKNNALYDYVAKNHINIKPYTRSDWMIFDLEGNQIDKSQLSDLVDEYKDALKSLEISRQSDNKDRFSVEDARNIDMKLLKHQTMELGDLQALAKMISIKERNEEKLFHYKTGIYKKESESNFLVLNGYVKLLDAMLSEAKATGSLQLFLSTEVVKIDHGKDEIVVHSKNGRTFNADAVICTLPLGVLQSGNVVFQPLLPNDKIKSINTLKSATHNKIIIEFEDVFWDNMSHFVVLYDPTLNAWLDIINLQFFTDKKTPILVASVYSSDHQPPPEDKYLVHHLTNILKRVYPESFRPIKKYWVTHWEQDPFSFGAYSYHPKGTSLEDNSTIARPVGRLVFAGEHTHRSPSNLQAAYLSGLEGARQVVDQLLHILESAAKH